MGINVSSESLMFIIDEDASAIEHQIEEIVVSCGGSIFNFILQINYSHNSIPRMTETQMTLT